MPRLRPSIFLSLLFLLLHKNKEMPPGMLRATLPLFLIRGVRLLNFKLLYNPRVLLLVTVAEILDGTAPRGARPTFGRRSGKSIRGKSDAKRHSGGLRNASSVAPIGGVSHSRVVKTMPPGIPREQFLQYKVVMKQ